MFCTCKYLPLPSHTAADVTRTYNARAASALRDRKNSMSFFVPEGDIKLRRQRRAFALRARRPFHSHIHACLLASARSTAKRKLGILWNPTGITRTKLTCAIKRGRLLEYLIIKPGLFIFILFYFIKKIFSFTLLINFSSVFFISAMCGSLGTFQAKKLCGFFNKRIRLIKMTIVLLCTGSGMKVQIFRIFFHFFFAFDSSLFYPCDSESSADRAKPTFAGKQAVYRDFFNYRVLAGLVWPFHVSR